MLACFRITLSMKFLKKILLIDHEPHVTNIIKAALEKTGNYTIRTERDGSFALHAARWFEPDLILLDVGSEGPDGDLLARQFQHEAHLRDTPVLSLSNLVPGPYLISGGILSGYSFFAAPIRLDEILRGVESLLLGESR